MTKPSREFWNDRRVTVTGGGGFLGRAVTGMLDELGAAVSSPPSSE